MQIKCFKSTDDCFDLELQAAVALLYANDCTQLDVPIEHALEVFKALSEDCYVIKIEARTTLWCMYSLDNSSPHYVGTGLCTIAMLSSAHDYCMFRCLLKHLKSVAIKHNQKWLCLNHKIRTGVYEYKFIGIK